MSEEKTIVSIKAIGDWELDVLGIPYGGPHDGKDSHGEYFDERTELHDDKFSLPPVVYYHGFGPDGEPEGSPTYIGKAVSAERKPDGVWYRVILDKTSELAKRVWQAAKDKIARASTGSIPHLIRVARDGHIQEWPVAELSTWDATPDRQPANTYAVALPVMKSLYKQAGITLPDEFEDQPDTEQEADAGSAALKGGKQNTTEGRRSARGIKNMDEKERELIRREAAEEARKALLAEQKAEEDKEIAIKARIDAAVKEVKDELAKDAEDLAEQNKKEAAKARRLPTGEIEDDEIPEGVNQAKMARLYKYDGLNSMDQALMIGVLQAAKRTGRSVDGATGAAYEALAVKALENKHEHSIRTKRALKAMGIGLNGVKADEIHYTTLSTFGDEWVGVEYSNRLWNKIRDEVQVLARIPQFEFPNNGSESMVIPLESTDPTFFKVAQANDLNATTGRPDATITSSQLTTAQRTMTLVKAGARSLWTGEMSEDSLIPFAENLRRQMVTGGAEQIEHALIDGDTATGASVNINDIAGTPDSTDLFLLWEGFRKSPLVTTTANSRSAGALDAQDFLETVKLMGVAGKNAVNKKKVTFIMDRNVMWKALTLPEVLSRDVFAGATIESGELNAIWGYEVISSAFMHLNSANLKANSAGKIDEDVTGNNTTGSMLAVRWDQWLFSWRRRMTLEVDRFAESDTNQIVALFRAGLTQRDTEASAISYNITV